MHYKIIVRHVLFGTMVIVIIYRITFSNHALKYTKRIVRDSILLLQNLPVILPTSVKVQV